MKNKIRFKSFKRVLKEEIKRNKERELSIAIERTKLMVSEQLVEIREKTGLTQAELAKKMRVSQQLVSRIESGSDNITLETLVRFLTILGVFMNIEIASRPLKQRDVLKFIR